MSFASLRNHSTYSLYKGLSKPIALAERAVQAGATAVAITDHNSLACTVKHLKAINSICHCGHHKDSHLDNKCGGKRSICKCTQYDKKEIKPILGCDLNISSDDDPAKISYLTVLCKNLDGWKNLLTLTSKASQQENVYHDTPRLSIETFSSLASQGNLIGISGFAGSLLADTLIPARKAQYTSTSYKEVRKFVSKETLDKTKYEAERLRDIFGEANFFLDTNLVNELPGSEVLTNAMRHLSNTTKIPCVYSGNSYYASRGDADDQRILLCSKLGSDFDNIDRKISLTESWETVPFFRTDKYGVADLKEIKEKHGEAEIGNSLLIADMCEEYNILGRPLIPEIRGPNGESPDEYLRDICRVGWKKKIEGKVPKEKFPEYKERIRYELGVMAEAKLSSYFLVVEDYIRYARSVGMITCKGRGSSAGSMIAYLTDITGIDPIAADLIFERFYNAGRNTADRVSLPDIDTDFPSYRRDEIFAYLKAKYGPAKTAHMATFSRMQGRKGLSEVFRWKYSSIPFSEVKKVTEHVPDEADINDELQVMKESGEDPSIIMWALDNNRKELRDYCYIDEDGVLQGQYKTVFEQAIRLEGTKLTQSRHASGIVISPVELSSFCPMLYDKSIKENIIGIEMGDAEELGASKYDILATLFLDKVLAAKQIIRYGRVK